MKIRNGFVSNSSSSSFIIKAEGEFKTVKDVAKYIIETVLSGWGQNYDYKKELTNLKKMLNPNTPVNFNTGGDQTYIRREEDKFVIVTTQNISFDALYNNNLKKNQIQKEFYKKFDFIDEYGKIVEQRDPEDFSYYYHKFNDFLVLEHNFYGRTTYVDNCPYCKSIISIGWILRNGNEVCECQLDKIINILKRKEKLKKISKNNEN